MRQVQTHVDILYIYNKSIYIIKAYIIIKEYYTKRIFTRH